jgi:chromosome partitioning protein
MQQGHWAFAQLGLWAIAPLLDGAAEPRHDSGMTTRHPPKLITFASPKGGVGKSTSCLSIAGALAKTGAPVKVIDLDQNGTLLRWGQKFAGQIENLTITTCAEAALGEQLLELVRSAEGYILLDLAGSLSTTMLQAAAIAHLTITPSQLSEPDIVEATKLYYQIRSVGEACGKAITHRILINAAPAHLTADRSQFAGAVPDHAGPSGRVC